jgi:DNA-directed RNA polymerase subunit omega
MARVTVEDCRLIVGNLFELVVLASKRAKDISAGTPITLERNNDKNPVIALREISAQTINVESLRESLIYGLRKRGKIDSPESDAFYQEEEDSLASADIMEDLESFGSDEMLSEEGDDFFDNDGFSEDNIDLEDE